MAFQRFDPISSSYSHSLKKVVKWVAIGSAIGAIGWYSIKNLKENTILNNFSSSIPTAYHQEAPKPLESLVSNYKL